MPGRSLRSPFSSLRARRALEADLEPSGPEAGGSGGGGGGGGGGPLTIGAATDRTADFDPAGGALVPLDPAKPALVTAVLRLRSDVTPTVADLETYSDPEANTPVGLYSTPGFHVEGAGPTDAWIEVPVTAIVPAGGSYYLNVDAPGPGAVRTIVNLYEQALGGSGGGGGGLTSYVISDVPEHTLTPFDSSADLNIPVVGSEEFSLATPALIVYGISAAVKRVDGGPPENTPQAWLRLLNADGLDFLQGVGGTFGIGIPSSWVEDGWNYFGNENGPGYILAPFMLPSGDYTFEYRLGIDGTESSEYLARDVAAILTVLAAVG
jgi:hypothetical protein